MSLFFYHSHTNIKRKNLTVQRFDFSYSRMKVYNIDLTRQKPADYWTKAIHDHLESIQSVKKYFDTLLSGTGTIDNSKSWTKLCLKWATKAVSYVSPVLYRDELKSIANICGFDLEDIMLLQLCYELLANCTVAIIQHPNDPKQVYMLRTMDWVLGALSELTIQVNFYSNGQFLYKAVTFAGYIGIATAVVPQKYAIAINFRRLNNGIAGNAMRLLSGSWPVGYLVREILKESSSVSGKLQTISQVQDALSQAILISPCYYSLAICNSINGSIVIARSPTKADHTATMSKHSHGILVQANMDQFEHGNAKEDILESIERVKLAKECSLDIRKRLLKNQSEVGLTLDEMLNLFLKTPILNDETVYACAIHVNSGVIHTKTNNNNTSIHLSI